MNYIAVCTPARDQVHTNYCYCMVNMVAYHTLNTEDAISLKLMQGTIIQNQRADLCLDAMAEGCTHILFIDSDMTFPQDMVQRLLKHDKEIVAANCARRRMPTGPTAQNYDENGKRQAVYNPGNSSALWIFSISWYGFAVRSSYRISMRFPFGMCSFSAKYFSNILL